jgi:hypothetical protein
MDSGAISTTSIAIQMNAAPSCARATTVRKPVECHVTPTRAVFFTGAMMNSSFALLMVTHSAVGIDRGSAFNGGSGETVYPRPCQHIATRG